MFTDNSEPEVKTDRLQKVRLGMVWRVVRRDGSRSQLGTRPVDSLEPEAPACVSCLHVSCHAFQRLYVYIYPRYLIYIPRFVIVLHTSHPHVSLCASHRHQTGCILQSINTSLDRPHPSVNAASPSRQNPCPLQRSSGRRRRVLSLRCLS